MVRIIYYVAKKFVNVNFKVKKKHENGMLRDKLKKNSMEAS